MTKTVWKFTLRIVDGVQKVKMPAGAIIQYCAMQDLNICFWCVVDPRAEQTERKFYVHGTGHPIDAEEIYVGSTLDPRGFVWHVFEIKD